MASLTASLAGGEEAAISQLKTSSEGLQDDEQLLQTTALELYALACEAGDAAAVAGAVENLLQDSPEQGRVLRRLLLATANVQFETAPGKRSAICNLLCELYLCDVIPETVVCDCLEQLLWNVSVQFSRLVWRTAGCMLPSRTRRRPSRAPSKCLFHCLLRHSSTHSRPAPEQHLPQWCLAPAADPGPQPRRHRVRVFRAAELRAAARRQRSW
jgi:hypothetical protein